MINKSPAIVLALIETEGLEGPTALTLALAHEEGQLKRWYTNTNGVSVEKTLKLKQAAFDLSRKFSQAGDQDTSDVFHEVRLALMEIAFAAEQNERSDEDVFEIEAQASLVFKKSRDPVDAFEYFNARRDAMLRRGDNPETDDELAKLARYLERASHEID